jgi:predicted nuclease of predicted toxin-antitoxin system
MIRNRFPLRLTEGHDVVETRERGDDPGDPAVLQWATAEGRVLITIDTDFGQLIFQQGAAHSGWYGCRMSAQRSGS